MSTPNTTAEYRHLYQFLTTKHRDLLAKTDQLEASANKIDQCTNLMQLRISTLVAQLDKVNTLMDNSLTPKKSLDELKKLEAHQDTLDLLSQIETSSDIDQALSLIPPHIKDLSQLPKNYNLPEVTQNWSPYNESINNLLASIKVNTNFNNDISSYKDLKRKIDDYQPSEFVLLGLANQEAEAKKRKKNAKQDHDVTDTSIILKDENDNSIIDQQV